MLSIITVNLNNAEGLRRTFRSVAAQECRDFQYIVVDGASGDGSVREIEAFADGIDYWVSEPDSGVYAAMNKGIAAATGDYCLFLNSGDRLFDGRVVAYANGRMATGSDVYYSDLPSDEVPGRFVRYPDELGLEFFLRGSINHQNSLIRLECLKRYGPYKEDYRIMADWHFYLKAKRLGGIRFEHLDRPLAYYRHDGLSADPRHAALRLREVEDAFSDVFGELGRPLFDRYRFLHSVYNDILELGGDRPAFRFALKAYRYALRRVGGRGR